MADLYNYVVLTGTIETDTADIQTEVQTEFTNAFGSSLSLSSSSPQGLLITEETLSRTSVADNNVALANQINPNLSGGVFLDALCALTAVQRSPNTYSLVVGTLTGVTGTIIPIGSLAHDTNQNQWQTTAPVTINGSTTVSFQAVVPGPLTIEAASLTSIVTNILGWETVTNAAPQTQTGLASQSDAELKTFRLNTLAAQGTALPLAILAGLYLTPDQGGAGCTSATFLENISGTTQVVKRNPSDASGVTMTGHSIYVCATGGTDVEIAKVLTSKKDGGAGYSNGASAFPVSVLLTVPISMQVIDVLFDRPDLIPIKVKVKISANTSVQDPVSVVTTALLNYANGLLPSQPGLVIGASVSAFEFAGAITFAAPGIFVLDSQVGLVSGSLGYATLPFFVWQLPTLVAGNIVVDII